MRLNKFIAQAGICSRRKADELISSGKIKINGQKVNTLGIEINEINDIVEYNGKIIKPIKNKIYLALNKPVGYISSVSSIQGKSVLDLIKLKIRIYPVGRLDKDSRGLILLTNDGEFAYQLTQAKFNYDKEYLVTLDRPFKLTDKKKLEQEMILDSQIVRGAKVAKIKGEKINLILHEGVNRQIRRMMKILGYEVLDLCRIRIGKLTLNNLPEGKYRKITPNQVI